MSDTNRDALGDDLKTYSIEHYAGDDRPDQLMGSATYIGHYIFATPKRYQILSGILFLFLLSAVSSSAQENDLLRLPDGVREKDFVQEYSELLDAPESICLAMLANPNPNDIRNPGGNFFGGLLYCLAKYFPTQDGNCISTTRKFNSLTRRDPALRQSLIAQHVKDHCSSRSRRGGK